MDVISILALLFVTAILTAVFSFPLNMMLGGMIENPQWISIPVCVVFSTWLLRLSWRTVAENAGLIGKPGSEVDSKTEVEKGDQPKTEE